MNHHKLIKKFNKQADTYDRIREKQYQGKWRKALLEEAHGAVLEAAIGAGGNYPYYRQEAIKKIIGVDFSPKMLEKAKDADEQYSLPVELIESDINQLKFEEDQFDTIVSTLSLCGYPNPKETLESWAKWCKPNGSILLLEHGISSNPFFSILQRTLDPFAVRAVGCHQNRNFKEIISRSPLEIKKAEDHWFGVFHLIWAKPQKRR
ncbi:class I SAM-dependent methyltransferase [Metabacillus sp. GX 13764]|uniref:class I SAM-dependent methyltransferase n=1 Tax=Metabacillus kandeliae TaxID=2900151 RepID=UPI001E46A778|nr:class I SAM-dependent methyltransferase [Metabacillus kandeliae]